VTMKGTPSPAATWEKSRPNSCRRPCSFLWPHWMARVSRQRLWHARKHCGGGAEESLIPESRAFESQNESNNNNKRGGGRKTHLLALGPLEVNVAVALAALGGRPQLPEPVGLRRFGQADVPERSGGHHHVGVHAVQV